MEALAQVCRSPSLKNEYLDIFEDEPESRDDVLNINMESFSSVIQSNLKKNRFYCSGYSYHTNLRRSIDMSNAKKLMGKIIFSAWVIPNTAYAKEESKVPLIVRQDTKRDIFHSLCRKCWNLLLRYVIVFITRGI